MSKVRMCKNCGALLPEKMAICLKCGARNERPFYQKPVLWVILAIVILAVVGGIAGSGDRRFSAAVTSDVSNTAGNSNEAEQTNQSVYVPEKQEFVGEYGISANAEMGSSIIDYPELSISIKNDSRKEISAIRFYFVPLDVYGEEIKGWTSQNHLYTDTKIAAGESTSITYQFIEDSIKKGNLYVYSVYYSDGTEWGDREATKSTILQNGMMIEVSGES